eukprot:gb/GFBE01069993.1/.p1 GENE.gb/GFBE01069993.1/~~gb/GFBE01069993.1/.p1  ORF type:complete len:369 (+),score=73.53 gb/GFBE01069993.1/:1-1107(+)
MVERTSVDLLELNIGGQVMPVMRSTLLQAPEGSLLHTMFSGRWDSSVPRDSAGRLFLDYPPQIFALVLDHLRTMSIASSALSPPTVPLEKLQAYSVLVEYLGLSNVFHGCLAPGQLSMDPVNCIFEEEGNVINQLAGVTPLQDGCFLDGWGAMSPSADKDPDASFVSSEPFGEGTVVWKLLLGGEVDDHCRVSVGVAACWQEPETAKLQLRSQGWQFLGHAVDEDGFDAVTGDSFILRLLPAGRSGGRTLQLHHVRHQVTIELHNLGGREIYPYTNRQRPAKGTEGILPGSWRVFVDIRGCGKKRADVLVCTASPQEACTAWNAPVTSFDEMRQLDEEFFRRPVSAPEVTVSEKARRKRNGYSEYGFS